MAVKSTRATVELSIEELGLLMNALWQDLEYQEPRRGPLEEDLRAGYDALQLELQDVIDEIDALSAGEEARGCLEPGSRSPASATCSAGSDGSAVDQTAIES